MNHFEQQGLQLLNGVQSNQLYQAFIQQLNKDFIRANIELQITSGTNPEELLKTLQVLIKELMLYRHSDYFNLLYAIDVSEKELKKVNDSSSDVIIDTIILLILKREWQKVWYKHQKG